MSSFYFRNVYFKTIYDQRRLTLWIGIGLIAAALYTTLLFPVIRDISGFEEFVDELPDFILSLVGGALEFTTPEGYLNTQPFSVLAPLLMLTYAVVRGSALVAGEEESHTLDQLLANPISRTSLVAQKSLGLLTGLMVLAVLLWASIQVGAAIAGFSVDLWNLTQIVFNLFLLAASAGMLAAGIGAATGKRGNAGGITAGVLVAGWLFNAIQQLAAVLEWTRFISVFWYYNGNNILLNGTIAWHSMVLFGVAAASIVAGAYVFQRRDLR